MGTGRLSVKGIKAAVAAVAFLAAGSAAAQQFSENQVSTKHAWSVYQETKPQECWAVAAPKETVNRRNGKVVAVRRSDIQLMVFFRPGTKVNGQVAFTGGYPFAPGSTVRIDMGKTELDMITDGEWAWPKSEGDDAKIVAAMKRGAEAVVTARSARGTQTTDTFSLTGFTAAVEEAAKRCAK